MNLFSTIGKSFRSAVTNLTSPAQWFVDLMGGGKTKAGVAITEKSAMNISAVFACVRVLAETVASLPLPVYRRLPEGGSEVAYDYPLYSVLHNKPNSLMTSFQFREVIMVHILLWGNIYILMNHNGYNLELIPLFPWEMQIQSVDGHLKYIYKNEEIPSDYLIHIPGLSFDGLVGRSVISFARESLGLSVAAEEYGERFFAGDASPSGVLTYPKRLGDDKVVKRLTASWKESHGGLNNKHKIAVLEEGMEYKQIGLSPEDSQFLGTRLFQIQEVARWFNMPLHKIQELSHATFSNIEHMSLEYVQHTVRPWLVRLEQALNWSLFSEKNRLQYFTEFNVDGLLRGDIKSRYDAYAVLLDRGVLSANEVRKKENLNPQSGDQGDKYYIALNMIAKDSYIQDDPNRSISQKPQKRISHLKKDFQKRSMSARRKLGEQYESVFRDAFNKIVKKENRLIRESFKENDAQGFRDWLYDQYPEFKNEVLDGTAGVFSSFAEDLKPYLQDELGIDIGNEEYNRFVDKYSEGFSSRHVAQTRARLGGILNSEILEEDLEALLTDWTEKRAVKETRFEKTRTRNAFAKAAYITVGIMKIRSVANGKSCPYCNDLDGQVIGIESNFLTKGEEFEPEGSDGPLIPSSNLSHPPYHGGCDCDIVAEV